MSASAMPAAEARSRQAASASCRRCVRARSQAPWQLPEFIAETGIEKIRTAVEEQEAAKKSKQKSREKTAPKMAQIDIDYQARAVKARSALGQRHGTYQASVAELRAMELQRDALHLTEPAPRSADSPYQPGRAQRRKSL